MTSCSVAGAQYGGQLAGVHVLMETNDLPVPQVPDVDHLGVQRLTCRLVALGPIAPFHDDGVAITHEAGRANLEPVELSADPLEDPFDDLLRTDDRAARGPGVPLGLVPLDALVHRPEHRRDVTSTKGLVQV